MFCAVDCAGELDHFAHLLHVSCFMFKKVRVTHVTGFMFCLADRLASWKVPFYPSIWHQLHISCFQFLAGQFGEKKIDLGSLEPTNHLLQAGALTPTLQGFAGYN